MKHRRVMAVMLLIVTGMQAVLAQRLVLNFWNGTTINYNLTQLDSISFEEIGFDESGIIGGREYVDLGLPSGTMWATMNVGARKPEATGDYFGWGETEPKPNTYPYSWYLYKHCYGAQDRLTKYCPNSNYGYEGYTDELKELQPTDDAATANWGSNWQTPSFGQISELTDTTYVTCERATVNSVIGIRVTSKKNGNSIFLPSTGRYSNTDLLLENVVYIWSRTLSPSASTPQRAYNLYSVAYRLRAQQMDRYVGMPVRPVLYQEVPYRWPVTSIKLTKDERTILLGQSWVFSATVLPAYATNTELTWESSDESVATMSGNKATAVGYGTCIITCRATDGSGVSAQCLLTVDREDVDLGLPSGTLWATCNVGAESETEAGDLFAWGETETKEDFSWENYKWMTQGEASYYYVNKYTFDDGSSGCWYDNDTFIGDGITELLPEDDAATAHWGVNWQMPSKEQFQELINPEYTTMDYVNNDTGQGLRITSLSNSKSIFLSGTTQYWSRSIGVSSSCACLFRYSYWPYTVDQNWYRYGGYRVRPVRKQ